MSQGKKGFSMRKEVEFLGGRHVKVFRVQKAMRRKPAMRKKKKKKKKKSSTVIGREKPSGEGRGKSEIMRAACRERLYKERNTLWKAGEARRQKALRGIEKKKKGRPFQISAQWRKKPFVTSEEEGGLRGGEENWRPSLVPKRMRSVAAKKTRWESIEECPALDHSASQTTICHPRLVFTAKKDEKGTSEEGFNFKGVAKGRIGTPQKKAPEKRDLA